MLPDWLRENATWKAKETSEANETVLEIGPDASDWENIFRVPIIAAGHVNDDEDITINVKLGVEMSNDTKRNDPLVLTFTDGKLCCGIQLSDPYAYRQKGPYRGIEGLFGDNGLRYPKTDISKTVTAATYNSDVSQVQMLFKPSEYFGTAFCAVDQGHKIIAKYSSKLKLSKGLTLEFYRELPTDIYRINYISVEIMKNSKAL